MAHPTPKMDHPRKLKNSGVVLQGFKQRANTASSN